MSLYKSRRPSLADKLEAQEKAVEAKRDELEKKDEEQKKIIKKSSNKK